MALRIRFSSSRFIDDEDGASAIEFALVAPVLVLACLATVDVGLAIGQKMDIDQTLRAASEGAMLDLGRDEVQDLAEAIAAENSTVASGGDDGSAPAATELEVTVDRFCACPESASTAVGCDSDSCADSETPYVFYRLAAEKEFASLFFPTIPISGSLLVQVR